jgi:hypothetical protein
MDFTVTQRKNAFVDFMQAFESEYLSQDSRGKFVFKSSIDMFNKTLLSAGSEGTVYITQFKKISTPPVILKQLDLASIAETKLISKGILNGSPDKVYKLFLTHTAFKKPSLIELIAQTLTNQLVLQNITPHFVMNYYWDYKKPFLNSYNEKADLDFHSWANQQHSDEEWFNALFQIMVGLAAMQRYFKILHTDFHAGNILVKKVTPGGYWVYTIDNFRYRVPNLGYVFLINDFGFSWIPKKLYVGWHVRDTLQYVTEHGKHFYDISHFVTHLSIYNLPTSFKAFLKAAFSTDELSTVMSSRYYEKKWKEYVDSGDANTKKAQLILGHLKKYPRISRRYLGPRLTIADKIYSIFYRGDFLTGSIDKSSLYSRRNTRSQKIGSFSLDKELDTSKLPANFKHVVMLSQRH